jgi:hypothetical protein
MDDGTALALFIELGAWLDPKLTEDDKRIVLDIIKRRVIGRAPAPPLPGESNARIIAGPHKETR